MSIPNIILKYRRLIKLALVLALALPVTAAAQNGGFAGAYSRMGFGPRGMAMGNAMTAFPQAGIYSHYNPALAAVPQAGIQVDLTTSVMSFDRRLNGLNASFSMPPNAGMNVSILNGHVGDIDGRTVSGYHTEDLSTDEFQFSSAFGIRFSNRVYGGLGVDLNMARFHSDVNNATSVGIDLGMLVRPTDRLWIGWSVQDLLASYTWKTGSLYNTTGTRQTKNDFPVRFKLGSSYQITPKWAVTGDFEVQRLNADVNTSSANTTGVPRPVTQNSEVSNHLTQLRFGTNYHIHERLTLRAGWQNVDLASPENTSRLSAGFSVHLPFDQFSPSVDYAFVREPNGIANMHVFAIRMHL